MPYDHDTPRTDARRRVVQRAAHMDAVAFFNVLTGPELLDRVEELLPDHRERLFPPTETLSMFLAQAMSADRSCQRAVNDHVVGRVVGGLERASTGTSGYCQARQRLPLAMTAELTIETGRWISDRAAQGWRWQGRQVRLVDGTTLTMPDTTANQATFPQQSNQRAGLGFPICRLVVLQCLTTGALLNAAIGRYQGKGGDEQTLLRSILDTLVAEDVLLGDAYYATYFLLCALRARGIDGVFEQYGARRSATDFRRGRRLGQRDHLIELTKPKSKPDWMLQADYDLAPKQLTVRELHTGGKVLVTTLCCANRVPKAEIAKLYRSRWHVELDLRNIKTTLGMERLSCKSPEMVVKEVWVYLLAYNLIRLLMVQSALFADLMPRQLSFKHTLQLWMAWSRGCDNPNDPILLSLIAENRVGNRPGRSEPRAVKRRPKPHPLLTIPRSEHHHRRRPQPSANGLN